MRENDTDLPLLRVAQALADNSCFSGRKSSFFALALISFSNASGFAPVAARPASAAQDWQTDRFGIIVESVGKSKMPRFHVKGLQVQHNFFLDICLE
ncbi:MAG: hypothetical protein A2X81_09385 [Desulfobacterales bacterium GWB2_56_26]|nr:MAG: hypothetical protein A2X81_09385 [Desulfobacterales bacterium GWB2_56_26]